MSRIIAMLPTYNEAENIGPLIDAILAQGPELEVLVVDDDSPDRTWKIVQEREKKDSRVHLLLRKTRRGRGLAGIAGFCEALRLGADAVIEMDADWSHDPKWIPAMIAQGRSADVVIGSRLAPGGGEEGRSFVRQWITRAANLYIRTMLRLPVRDATSGYRLFSRRCLEAIPWNAMRATGPEVVQEVLLAAHARGFTIAEVPILFVERRHGQSTFNSKIMIRSLAAMYRLRKHPGRLVPDKSAEGGIASEALRQSLTRLPAPLTIPLSWLYGLGRKAHRAWNVWGPLKREKLPVAVVCVGNLTVGGTGKTPFVQFMAETFKNRGFKPAIVSRGYHAEERLKAPLVVSDGERMLATAAQAGDEPQWLAEHCPGVPVVVCPDRYRAGLLASQRLGADLIILDDGFQHDRLRRNLDLVLWDVGDEPRRMRLLPAGRLREGLGALRRADAIVLTHGEYLPEPLRQAGTEEVIHQLKRRVPAVAIFEAETKLVGYQKLSGRIRPEAEEAAGDEKSWPWTGRRVICVSGLARPQGFEAMVKASGGIIVQHFAYPDHFAHHAGLAGTWREAMERHGAEMILTTNKDAVKLALLPLFGLPILAVSIAMAIKDTGRWEAFLKQRLKKKKRAKAE